MRILDFALACSLTLTLAACGDTPVEEGPPETVPLGQLGPDVTPTAYRLDLRIVPTDPRFSGTVEIDLDLAKPKSVIYLHAKNLAMSSISAKPESARAISGTFAKATDTGVAKLTFAKALPKGKSTLTIQYDAPLGDKPDTIWVAEESQQSYVATQFEALGARQAFPSFDEPRFKTPFTISITARATDTVVSNAAMDAEQALSKNMKKITFKPTQPLPTYLVALAVGPYDVVEFDPIPASALRPEPIPLRGITVKGKGEQIKYALSQTAPMLKYLEDYFGVAYPFGKLDLIAPPNFGPSGMENAGLIAYAERVIFLDEKSSSAQQARFFNIHAHELAHQWFGDLVTPKWWDDIWLNESFATWMAAKTASAVRPGQGYERAPIRNALGVMDTDSLDTARAVRQPINSDDDIFNAFDGLTYQKGASVLSMFEGFVGEDKFRTGVQIHIKRFAHGNATAKDFLNSLSEGTKNPDIAAAFETFLTQPGVPIIRTTIKCDRGVGVGEMAQSPFAPVGATALNRMWKVPMCLRNMNRNEPQQCALISAKAAQVAMMDVCPNPALQMNAGARGYYRFDVGPAGWTALIAKVDQMPPGEQLAVIDSLRASFTSGNLDAKTYIDGLAALALAKAPDVVTSVGNNFAELRDKLVPEKSMPALEAKLRALYAPALKAASLTAPAAETNEQAERRVSILTTATKSARDPATLKSLKGLGDAILSGKPDAVEPNLLPLAMWATASLDGPVAVKRMIAAVNASTDSEFRTETIKALSGARGADAMKLIGEFTLSDGMRTRERAELIRELFKDGEVRAKGWAWMKPSMPALYDKTSGPGRTGYVRATENFCDAIIRADVENFFRPKVSEMPGAPRVLANALEQMNRCIALKTLKSEEVSAALGPVPKAPRPPKRKRS